MAKLLKKILSHTNHYKKKENYEKTHKLVEVKTWRGIEKKWIKVIPDKYDCKKGFKHSFKNIEKSRLSNIMQEVCIICGWIRREWLSRSQSGIKNQRGCTTFKPFCEKGLSKNEIEDEIENENDSEVKQ